MQAVTLQSVTKIFGHRPALSIGWAKNERGTEYGFLGSGASLWFALVSLDLLAGMSTSPATTCDLPKNRRNLSKDELFADHRRIPAPFALCLVCRVRTRNAGRIA